MPFDPKTHLRRSNEFDEWLLHDEDEKPLHYLGGQFYAYLASILEATPPAPGTDMSEEWAREARELEEREEERRHEQD